MAEPASKLAAGSVGTVETQYLDLPEPVRLDCGRELHRIRVAYETYGTLSAQRDIPINQWLYEPDIKFYQFKDKSDWIKLVPNWEYQDSVYL